MSDDQNRTELFSLINQIHANQHGHLYQEVRREDLKYAIYLRKSSDETSDKQTKSISDQFSDIKSKILDPLKITNYEIIKEEHSARTANTRQEFKRMISLLENGYYQGLIAWHPDRLARNMLEGGLIIDLWDRYAIQDLLFATASYENNANGKMMLGITFALSKQYSEHLGESVLRGYEKRVNEGKYLGKLVHGYKIMRDGMLEPDGDNWLIIQQAFQKRLQQNPESQSDIAKWLNQTDYSQCYGREQKRSRTHFTDKKVSALFKEYIYAGFLVYGKAKPVDLVDLYGFEPMITAEEYQKLNRMDNLGGAVTQRGIIVRNNEVTLLQGRVTCGHCGSFMHFSTGTGKMGKSYAYFRCDDPSCPYKLENPNNPKHTKHQMRAHVVTNAAIDTLKAAQFDLKKAYENYVDDARTALYDEQQNLLSQERRVRANIHNTEDDLKKAKQVVADPERKDVAKFYKDDIKKYVEVQLPSYQRELEDIKRRQKGLKESIVSEEKFLKLMQNLVNYIGDLTDLEQINEILQMFYSNFAILDRNVSVITFNQEWYEVLNPAWLSIRV